MDKKEIQGEFAEILDELNDDFSKHNQIHAQLVAELKIEKTIEAELAAIIAEINAFSELIAEITLYDPHDKIDQSIEEERQRYENLMSRIEHLEKMEIRNYKIELSEKKIRKKILHQIDSVKSELEGLHKTFTKERF